MSLDALEITSIQIQNFRSIVDVSFEPKRLNVFVGLNDVGKSNFLKALFLFFEGKTPDGQVSFARDFCKYAKTPEKKAKEIRIQLTFRPPSSYGSRQIVWKQVWRQDGLYDAGCKQCFEDKSAFPPRSRIPALLKNIRFSYIPAVKGDEYFSGLMAELHDVLVEAVDKKIRGASEGFTKAINSATEPALDAIEKILGIKSSIQLPSDLRDLFSRLEFQSTGVAPIPLSSRGDGIRVRHIPILLRYISNKAKDVRSQGSPTQYTFWAFEEPENNLEMLKAYELAQELNSYSEEIQIFATSHSPAFYSLGLRNESAEVLLVQRSETGNSVLEPVDKGTITSLDEHLGLLPFIIPSFENAIAEKERYRNLVKISEKAALPSIFVEGKTDAMVLKSVLGSLAPELLEKVDIKWDTSAGAGWVKDQLLAWTYGNNPCKALGICDSDEAGRKAKDEFNENAKVKSASAKESRVKLIQQFKPDLIAKIFQRGLKLAVGLEELFPLWVWRYAEGKQWLENRSDAVALNGFDSLDKTFVCHCQDLGATEDEMLFITKRVSKYHKEELSKYVCKLGDDEKKLAFVGFTKLVDTLKSHFS